jgi:hypothetical protein
MCQLSPDLPKVRTFDSHFFLKMRVNSFHEMVGFSAHTRFTKNYTCTGCLTLKHKTLWDFGVDFTPISCPIKNPMVDKIL